ncbi:hypothetical protein OG369_01785 [Streptomyces sp. NBC_01221]|uniref:hypothetical protein n=1 Tax=unclassified Streptomyces TaxID=2593676 RepID=UPI002251B5FC|nr:MULTISPECIES: hypothetical protein [unclassified Streptomyces]MCX4784967.1 hypothetical protein [Streptomyces sp. NBC_01221]WSJ40278.1 hypothetical protein OG772_32710 [Streptomyces sp. NBC_01321]WSU25752.1 hypothetical protein OG508_35745 [Streptomyces sp. NBC_01108]
MNRPGLSSASQPRSTSRFIARNDGIRHLHIDGFYNSRRIQKRLGYLNPVEFEEKHYVNQATTERTNLKPRQPLLTT